MKLNIRIKDLFSLFLALFMAIILVNCGGDKDESTDDTVQPTFSSLYNKVFVSACVSCHAPGESAYDTDGVIIDFRTAAQAYTDLTTRSSTGPGSGVCNGTAYIAADAADSYLAAVVVEDVATSFNVGGCTTPLATHYNGLTSLSAAEINALSQWINNGAQNN